MSADVEICLLVIGALLAAICGGIASVIKKKASAESLAAVSKQMDDLHDELRNHMRKEEEELKERRAAMESLRLEIKKDTIGLASEVNELRKLLMPRLKGE